MRIASEILRDLSDLKSKDLSDLFLDIELIYSKGTEPFFLVKNAKNDPVFLDTVYAFMSSRCFASIPNAIGGANHVSFYNVMQKGIQVDPSDDLITDDSEYLKFNSSEASSTFIHGFKEVLKTMPPEVRASFMQSLNA